MGTKVLWPMKHDTGFPVRRASPTRPSTTPYETGPLHVTMLGCYVDYLRDSEQAAWLKKDLAAVDRERTPWVIVGMHVSAPPGVLKQEPTSLKFLSTTLQESMNSLVLRAM